MNQLENVLVNGPGKRAKLGKPRLVYEDVLKRLPPDILRELTRRRLAELHERYPDLPEPPPSTWAPVVA
jgi:hypothetical protein